MYMFYHNVNVSGDILNPLVAKFSKDNQKKQKGPLMIG